MENLKKEDNRPFFKTIAEEKYKFILLGYLTLGVIIGSLSCALYGGEKLSGAVEEYCGNLIGTAISITATTIGFIAVIFLCGLLKITLPLIFPTVCFRGMGFGSLICGVIQADSIMGMCFAALVILPYAAFNSALAIYAGEYSLGIRSSFGEENSGLTRSLKLHTLKISSLCLLAAIFSCALFVISCKLFGNYLL